MNFNDETKVKDIALSNPVARQHVHLENNILFPRSVEMETAPFDRPFRLSSHFESCGRCEMQEDERDVLEVLIFDEIEETVGTWLRAIIQRLEKEQTAIREITTRSKPQAAKH